jgi:hypothetical protein
VNLLKNYGDMKNVRTTLTREAGGLFERYADLGGVPSAVTTVKEEGRLADCTQIGDKGSSVVGVGGV